MQKWPTHVPLEQVPQSSTTPQPTGKRPQSKPPQLSSVSVQQLFPKHSVAFSEQ